MDERSLDAIYRYSSKRIAEVSLAKKRYLYDSVEQIKDIPGSFLAVDGTEVGRGNRIPLWLFGFLY